MNLLAILFLVFYPFKKKEALSKGATTEFSTSNAREGYPL
jgi:hypothetical protein